MWLAAACFLNVGFYITFLWACNKGSISPPLKHCLNFSTTIALYIVRAGCVICINLEWVSLLNHNTFLAPSVLMGTFITRGAEIYSRKWLVMTWCAKIKLSKWSVYFAIFKSHRFSTLRKWRMRKIGVCSPCWNRFTLALHMSRTVHNMAQVDMEK